MKTFIEIILFFLGGFIAVVICSEYDAWKRYRKKVGKDAFKTVYNKICNIEQSYFCNGNQEASNDCIRLQNLLNYFKDEICDNHNYTERCESMTDFINNEADESRKVRVKSAEIVVHGTADKPYYEIKYYDLSDEEWHIGYSSYDLKNIFGWLEECFEIINETEI